MFANAIEGVSAGLFIFYLILVALFLAFEIWMFIDAIKNPYISTNRRILWLLGIFLIHPVVAIIYYFTDHKLHHKLK